MFSIAALLSTAGSGLSHSSSNTTAVSSFLDTLQAIAAEASDYSRRSLENRSSFVAKLSGATTFESAIQIQRENAKTSYAGFIAYLMKMTDPVLTSPKEFFKPIEAVVAGFGAARNRLCRFGIDAAISKALQAAGTRERRTRDSLQRDVPEAVR